jgi:hypothetical protein
MLASDECSSLRFIRLRMRPDDGQLVHISPSLQLFLRLAHSRLAKGKTDVSEFIRGNVKIVKFARGTIEGIPKYSNTSFIDGRLFPTRERKLLWNEAQWCEAWLQTAGCLHHRNVSWKTVN